MLNRIPEKRNEKQKGAVPLWVGTFFVMHSLACFVKLRFIEVFNGWIFTYMIVFIVTSYEP